MTRKKGKTSRPARRRPKKKCQDDRDSDGDFYSDGESLPEDVSRTSFRATTSNNGLSLARRHCHSVESDSVLPSSNNINNNNLHSPFDMIQTPPSEGTSELTSGTTPWVQGTQPSPPSELGVYTADKSHYSSEGTSEHTPDMTSQVQGTWPSGLGDATPDESQCSCLFWIYIQLFVVGLCAYMPLTMVSNLVEGYHFNTGIMNRINTVLHLVTMPMLGYLGGKRGGNYVLTISLVLSAFSYGLLLLPLRASFYLSRVLSSATHSLFGAQLLVMEKTCPNHRATAFSVVILSYGLGMIAGPVCGSVLSTALSYSQLFGLTALLSLGNLAYFLKNTKPKGRLPTSLGTSSDPGAVATSWSDMVGLNGSHSVQPLLIIRLLLLLPAAIFHERFQVMTVGKFAMHPDWTALITYTLNIVSLTSPRFALTNPRRHFTGSLLTSDLAQLFNWLMAVYLVLAVSWWSHLGLLVALCFPLTAIVSCLCVAVSADVTIVAPPGTAASALAVSHLMQLLLNRGSLPLPPSLACLVGVLCSALARRIVLRQGIVTKASWKYACGLCEKGKPAAAVETSYPNPIESEFIINGQAAARNALDEACFSDNE